MKNIYVDKLVIDTKGYRNLEAHINSKIGSDNDRKLTNVDCDEKGVLTLSFDKYASGKVICKVFSRTRIVRHGGKKNKKEIKRGYDSVEEAEEKGFNEVQKRSLAENGFEIVKEIELKKCWLVFYSN